MTRIIVGLIALGGALAVVGPARAQDSSEGPVVGVSFETMVASRYVWRGYDLSQRRAALQPYAELALPGGVGLNAFGTWALDRQTELDEAQLGVTYDRSIGSWEIGTGYALYLMPGTETEPGTDPDDPLAPGHAGEFLAWVTRSVGPASIALTYGRGTGSARGNSVNLRVEMEVTPASPVTLAPTFQADYLDQYGPPAGLGNRIASLELGLPIRYRVGGISLAAAGYLTVVPSPYIREANAAAGASSRTVLPWVAVGISFDGAGK